MRIALLLSCLLLTSRALADDGAASIAAGGLVLMKREPRITMAKEVLNISESSVDVSYEFRNDSAEDITTEVAFPIPSYGICCGERDPTKQGFDDFKLWVNGEIEKYSTELRATVHGHDVTDQLRALHIDVATFGNYTETEERSIDFDKLTPSQRQRLITQGIAESRFQRTEALWQVQKKYHWRQVFPAHAVVRIRHTYTPWLGSSNGVESALMQSGKHPAKSEKFPAFCATPGLLKQLQKHQMSLTFVDFILTSANTWKRPIEDFTLNVDRGSRADYISFCWDGPVEKVDARHFTAHTTNLTPSRELRIGFLKNWPQE